jgi:hypothetical protein
LQISRTSILIYFFLKWVQKKLEVQKPRTTTSSGHNSQHPVAHICSIMPTKNIYWFSYSSRDILLFSYKLYITLVLQTVLHPYAGMFIRCLYTKRHVLTRSNPPSVATKRKQKTILRDHHVILQFTKLMPSQMWLMYHVRRTK